MNQEDKEKFLEELVERINKLRKYPDSAWADHIADAFRRGWNYALDDLIEMVREQV